MPNPYNGKFTTWYQIVVKADNHDDCLKAFNRIKKLVEILNFGNIWYQEYKSARKGDVLSREIQVAITDYSTDVLIFRSILDCQIHKTNRYYSAKVSICQVTTIREDDRFNLEE